MILQFWGTDFMFITDKNNNGHTYKLVLPTRTQNNK